MEINGIKDRISSFKYGFKIMQYKAETPAGWHYIYVLTPQIH